MLGKDWKVVKTSKGNRRIYTRKCDLCKTYYEGRGAKFCSKSCACKWGRQTKDYSKAVFKKGKANPNGKGLTQEHKNKLSKMMKERWKNGLITSTTFRPKETSLEKIARQALEELGIKFKSKFWINIKGYSPKEYDFYIPSLNLLLEVDGEYWHSLPKNIENDKYKNELAKVAGYRLLRIPEKLALVELIKISIKKEEVNGVDNPGQEHLPVVQSNS